MPLTDYALTKTALMVESAPGLEDWHPLNVDYGGIAVSLPGCIAVIHTKPLLVTMPTPVRPLPPQAFHGTLNKHSVPANASRYTRASLDFRVGIEPFFDNDWVLKGTKAGTNHGELPPSDALGHAHLAACWLVTWRRYPRLAHPPPPLPPPLRAGRHIATVDADGRVLDMR